MMDKQVQFFGKTASGIHCVSLFGSSGAFEKTAGAPAFADWQNGDELRSYISKISKEDREKNAYVLVNALGAGEYFGSNINADYFPWNSLAHEGDDYGYKTFLKAHAFQHHVNKDPTRAFGVPVLSLLNTQMKRVELVVKLNREKARAEGADGIIVRIDKGEFPDVSMGCKVPFDVCYVCGHRSKTKDDYCVHMRPPEDLRHIYGPNKILADGKRCCVINTVPRFFDISFVFIGADKTAKVMAKLASKGNQVCLGDVCSISRPQLSTEIADKVRFDEPGEDCSKVASASDCSCGCGTCGDSEKVAGTKLGEITKTVPAGTFALKALPSLEKNEVTISRSALDEMAEHDLGSACSTAAMMGIVLKPREFQRLVLVRMGERELADDLDSRGQIFTESSSFDNSLSIDKEKLNPAIKELLSSLVGLRSGFGFPLQMRIIRISSTPKKTLPTESAIDHPLLNKVAAAYNGYRQSLVEKLSQAEEVIMNDPKLREEVFGDSLVNMFTKTASTSILSPDSLSYFAGVHLQNRDLLSDTLVDAGVSSKYQTQA